MSMVITRPFQFAQKVIVDGVKGVVIESNSVGLTVQFVQGKATITWVELDKHPHKVRHYKEVMRIYGS